MLVFYVSKAIILKAIIFYKFSILQYDTVHGRYPGTVTVENGKLIIDGKAITVSNEREPENIKWGNAGADYVVEATGKFLTAPGASKHFVGGKRSVFGLE